MLGVRVDCIRMQEALETIAGLVARREGGLVATVNPEIVMRARRDREYAAVLDAARLCVPDGVGVVWAARRLGCRQVTRVTGIDLVSELAARADRHGWRIFLLGSRPGVGARAAAALESRNPGLKVVGVHPGSPSPTEDADTVAMIQAAGADVVFVAFGFPEQERWVARVQQRLPGVVGVGVGGTFDFLAGAVPRAPGAFQRLGLEWLFRLVRQPWRARRMAVLPIYALQVLRERRES